MRLRNSVITLALLAASLTSCNSVIYDYDKECREGIELRFVYDYNMEWADAFPSQMHCLTVLVYDEAGNLVESRVERSEALNRPGYNMVFDLPQGHYHVAAYGGMGCDDASFAFDAHLASLKQTERTVSLCSQSRADGRGATSDVLLHDHFFGMVDVDVPEADFNYATATVEMMKNTNHFRIILQQIDGRPLTSSQFKMNIVDDNVRFAHDNSIIPTDGGITYGTWSMGETSVGTNLEGEDWKVVHGDLSTSRLITRAASRSAATPTGSSNVDSPRLIITRTSDDAPIVDIPLLKYMLLMKSDRYSKLSDQEFLDRQSQWNIVLFLDKNLAWINTQIVVNDWVVRINDANL